MRASSFALALLFTALTSLSSAQSGTPTATYPAATWLNDAAHESVGRRVIDAMRAAGLHPAVTCTVGCTVSVPGAEYATALGIARQLVSHEHLDIAVVEPVITS